VWLAGGNFANFDQNAWYAASADRTLIYGYGFSGRLLKN